MFPSLDFSSVPSRPFVTLRCGRLALTASLSLLVCTAAPAGVLNWDSSPTVPDGLSAGGTGTWDLTSNTSGLNEWDSGTAYVPWTNLGFDTAVFGGTSDTVTVSGTIATGGLKFQTSDYVLTGGTLNLGGTAPSISVDSGALATVKSVLTGSGGFTKTGGGTLALTANSGSLSGGLTISAGEARFSHANALGSGAVTLGDAATGANNVSLYLDTATARTSFGGTIVVSNNGTGTATLGSVLSSSGTGNNNYFANIILQRDVIFDSSAADRTDYRNITGTGNITVTGPGRSFFTSTANTNTFAGNLTVATTGSGNLQIGSNSGAFNFIPDASDVIVNAGAKLVLSTTEEAINGLSGSGTIDTNTSLTVPYLNLIVGAANGSATFDGTLADGTSNAKKPLALTKIGTGTQTLNGANSYSGPTTVNGGILQIASNGLIDTGSQTTINSGGTLKITGDGILRSSAVRINEGGVLNVSNTSGVYKLDVFRTLTIAGEGSSNSHVVGNFQVEGGTIAIGTPSAFGTANFGNDLKLNGGSVVFNVSSAAHDELHVGGSVNVTAPTALTMDFGGQTRVAGTYTLLAAGGLTGAANLSLGVPEFTRQTFTLDTSSRPNTVSLVVTGTASDLTWTGQVGSNWDVGSSSEMNWKTGGTDTQYYNLDAVTFNDTASNKLVSLNSTVTPGGVTFDNSAGNDYTLIGFGSISGSTSLVKRGAGRLFVENSNVYTGTTRIVQGDLISTYPSTGAVIPFGTNTIQIGDASTGEGNTAALRLAGANDLNQPIVVSADGTGTALIGTYGSGVSGNATTISGPIALGRATTFEATTVDQLLISGVITGEPGKITIQGTGRTTFSANNDFVGDIKLRGTAILQLNGGVGLNATNSVDVAAGTTLQLYNSNAFNYTINALTGSGTVRSYTAKSLTLTVGAGGGSGTFEGKLTDYQTNNSLTLALTKAGSGTQTLSGTQNTYTGATIVSGGTLLVSGSLSGTASVAVNSGARLELAGIGNHINDVAPFTLAGGTLAAGGASEGSESSAGFGILRLTANSILDFAEVSGSGLLHFADSHAQTWGSATLSIYNWSPDDRLFFGSDNTALTSAQLAKVVFYSDAGFTPLGSAKFVESGMGEITVVPEPSTSLIGLVGAASLGMRRRRRRA
ncbi:beta strand repeat-containing protein [Verrucomicrobiota bacterium sgz303538]